MAAPCSAARTVVAAVRRDENGIEHGRVIRLAPPVDKSDRPFPSGRNPRLPDVLSASARRGDCASWLSGAIVILGRWELARSLTFSEYEARTGMNFDEFTGQVQHRLELAETGEAVRAIRATLSTLGERIPEGNAEDLAASPQWRSSGTRPARSTTTASASTGRRSSNASAR